MQSLEQATRVESRATNPQLADEYHRFLWSELRTHLEYTHLHDSLYHFLAALALGSEFSTALSDSDLLQQIITDQERIAVVLLVKSVMINTCMTSAGLTRSEGTIQAGLNEQMLQAFVERDPAFADVFATAVQKNLGAAELARKIRARQKDFTVVGDRRIDQLEITYFECDGGTVNFSSIPVLEAVERFNEQVSDILIEFPFSSDELEQGYISSAEGIDQAVTELLEELQHWAETVVATNEHLSLPTEPEQTLFVQELRKHAEQQKSILLSFV